MHIKDDKNCMANYDYKYTGFQILHRFQQNNHVKGKQAFPNTERVH